jgi:hypothetical protein
MKRQKQRCAKRMFYKHAILSHISRSAPDGMSRNGWRPSPVSGPFHDSFQISLELRRGDLRLHFHSERGRRVAATAAHSGQMEEPRFGAEISGDVQRCRDEQIQAGEPPFHCSSNTRRSCRKVLPVTLTLSRDPHIAGRPLARGFKVAVRNMPSKFPKA